MGVWTYAYLFSHPSDHLDYVSAFEEISSLEMTLDSEYTKLTESEDGHCIESDYVSIDGDPEKLIKSMLNENSSLQITFRNNELFITCTFSICGLKPYINLAWPKKIFNTLTATSQKRYIKTFNKIAQRCGAIYVIFVEEAPDYFEDKFIFIDNVPYIDLYLSNGRFHPIDMIWIKTSEGGLIPRGANFNKGHKIGNGFYEYLLNL